MRPVWLVALAASGCRAILGIEPPARSDGGPDGAACAGWQPEGFDPCALAITSDALDLGDAPYVYDTTAGTLYDAAHQAVLHSGQAIVQGDGSPLAVLSIGRLTTSTGTRLGVTGSRPLLIVSWSSIVIDGTLDAGSHLGITDAAAHIAQTVQFGAGANQGCLTGAGRDGSDASTGGSGGGGGGGLQGVGGAGGGGDPGASGGGGGMAVAITAVHGGCPGGASGAAGAIATFPAAPGSRALGGAGGGAIRLVARDSIDVSGAISANGAGGAGAPTSSACGGGGGGAGGYIGFEAPVVTLRGSVTANGGGGGGGGSSSSTGNDGSDGVVGAQPASGGAIATGGCGQAGGRGAASTSLDGMAADAAGACQGGGGGGGGASGFIVIRSPGYTPGAATLSPAPQVR